jgi:hypothetical protein
MVMRRSGSNWAVVVVRVVVVSASGRRSAPVVAVLGAAVSRSPEGAVVRGEEERASEENLFVELLNDRRGVVFRLDVHNRKTPRPLVRMTRYLNSKDTRVSPKFLFKLCLGHCVGEVPNNKAPP